MKITLQQIRDHSPCRDGWTKLLKSLGNPSDLSMQVSIGQIARSNGPQDALWCLRCADFDRRDVVRCILPAVKRAAVHTDDKRVHDCISALDRWVAGDDSVDLAAAARAATWAAKWAADATRAAAKAALAAASWAAEVATGAARAALAAASWAAEAATGAARAATDATREKQQQIEDIQAVFP